MNRTAVDTTGRWKTCLHEAGHLVAAKWLMGHSGGAVVFSDGSGAASTGGAAIPASFKEAMTAAAGSAAETLADMYPPPETLMLAPLEEVYPEPIGRLKTRVAALMSDEVAIARWCIDGRESEPDLWAGRHDWVTGAAEDFIGEHRMEIVEIATGLLGRGIITLPAQPGKES